MTPQTEALPYHGLSRNEYNSIHQWVRQRYSHEKTKCESTNCWGKSKKLEFALIKGKLYERNRENYIVLCTRCHREYDECSPQTRKKMSESQKKTPKPWSWRSLYAEKNGDKKFFPSLTAASKEIGIHISCIMDSLKGRTKSNTSGYKFYYANE